MKDKVDSFVSMANMNFVENTSSLEDDNRVDKDPPKWEHIRVEVPVTKGKEEQIPKFDHDDGLWTTDMKRKKREVSQQVRKKKGLGGARSEEDGEEDELVREIQASTNKYF